MTSGLLYGPYGPSIIRPVGDFSNSTVKNHVSGILSKLGVRDRTRAVLRALELGHLK
jgi:hypothetical protein